MNENAPAPDQPEFPQDAPANAAVPPPLDAAPRTQDDKIAAIQNHVALLQAKGDNGAKWFFWVAGLSLVNTGINLFGGGIYFVVGLGVTLITDVLTVDLATKHPESAVAAKSISIAFTLVVALVLCGFGWLSRKRIIPIFAIGMVLYLLDGLLFVLFKDWMSVAFHAYALYAMFGGFAAYRQLNSLRRQFAGTGR